MMKLFIMYIGGIHEKAFIELHDMRFVIASNLEETYENLRQNWWGTSSSLHIDAWGVLEYADGHDIVIKNYPSENENKLYFVNLGGYDRNEFTELHKNVFVVAPTDSKAKVKGLKQILDWESHHRDYQFELENIVDISKLAAEENLYIHLIPSEKEKKFQFSCKYLPIGKE